MHHPDTKGSERAQLSILNYCIFELVPIHRNTSNSSSRYHHSYSHYRHHAPKGQEEGGYCYHHQQHRPQEKVVQKGPRRPRRFTSAYIFFSSKKHKELRAEFVKRGEPVCTTQGIRNGGCDMGLLIRWRWLQSTKNRISKPFTLSSLLALHPNATTPVHHPAGCQARLCGLAGHDPGGAPAV